MVLGISTPLEANNFYSQLLQAKKPDGRPLFNVLEVTTLCEECIKAGKLQCPHKTELPSWKTSERQVRTVIKKYTKIYIFIHT